MKLGYRWRIWSGGRESYMAPCKKVALNAIFCKVATLSLNTGGSGMRIMTAPVVTLGIAMYLSKAAMLRHLACFASSLPDPCHAACTGEHWKMAARVLAIAVAVMIEPIM